MFDTIILLTGPTEHSVFTTLLGGHNPGLNVVPVFTAADLAAIEPDWLRRARLISLNTEVIVPGPILDRLGYGAYNFHPGPPSYPGWAPAHFALYERAGDFGCTMHRMIERVDAGPIVEVEVFDIPPGISVGGLEEMTYARLVQMFWRMARVLATQSSPLIERAVRWGSNRHSRKAYESICNIPLSISPGELKRRAEVFGTDHFGIVPSIQLHGVQFRMVLPEADVHPQGAAKAEA